MYLFSRVSTVAPGRLKSAPGFIAEVTAHVNDNTPFDFAVWGFQFGRPVGTVGWSAMVDDLAAFLDASAELTASSAYVDKVNSAGDLFVGPAEDFLRQVVHVAGEPPETFAYTAGTAAVVAQDYSKTLQWSIEMADLAHATTGLPTMFLRDVYGTFGGVMWLSAARDSAAVAAAQTAIAGSSEYLAKLDDTNGMFVPGSGRQTLLRRML